MRLLLSLSIVLTSACTLTWAADSHPIIPDGAKFEKVWGDGTFTEGPAYGPGGCLYFTDIGNRIMKYDPKAGKTTVYREASGKANGLDFDPQGRLIACEGHNGGNRRVSITEKDGKVRTLCDKWMGKRFNSPNDVTVDTKGRAYFSDPRFGEQKGREIDTESVYRVDPDGKVTQVISDTNKPNGVLLSPDMKTLYVAENAASGDKFLLAYPVSNDGSVGKRRVVYSFGKARGIDGMVCDVKGNIYGAAGKDKTAGLYIISPDGKKLGFIPIGELPTNCVFGDKDRKSLYLTAGKSLYRVKLNVPGFAVYWPNE